MLSILGLFFLCLCRCAVCAARGFASLWVRWCVVTLCFVIVLFCHAAIMCNCLHPGDVVCVFAPNIFDMSLYSGICAMHAFAFYLLLMHFKCCIRLLSCNHSASPPGGNQVDGLPPALHVLVVVAGARCLGKFVSCRICGGSRSVRERKICMPRECSNGKFPPEPPSPKSNAEKFGPAGGRSLRARVPSMAVCGL